MKRIRAVMLVVLLIMMTAIPVFNVASAEETTGEPDNVFTNVLKKGSVEVTKTAEDGLVEGIKFHLYGTSDSGQKVDMYATTDVTGKAVFEDMPIGTYILSEPSVPDGYVIPEDMEVKVTYEEIT